MAGVALGMEHQPNHGRALDLILLSLMHSLDGHRGLSNLHTKEKGFWAGWTLWTYNKRRNSCRNVT